MRSDKNNAVLWVLFWTVWCLNLAVARAYPNSKRILRIGAVFAKVMVEDDSSSMASLGYVSKIISFSHGIVLLVWSLTIWWSLTIFA